MNWKDILRRARPEKGLALTLLIGIFLSWFYFHKLFRDPGHTYFSQLGDGFQIYYETIYHNRYDKTYWHQESTNYPYGEGLFFTGALPFITNLVRPFDHTGNGAIWLINMMMLLSPLIGAVFIYLIFRHLKVHWIYAAICANGIAFLSPQIMRMGGHYSLQWVFLIPAFVYLLLKFYDYPNLKKSWAIAFLVFLGGATHLYFLVFFFALGGIYWLVLFVTRDRGFGRWLFSVKHASIQLLLPAALILFIQGATDSVTDRTAFPWGYTVFHSNTDGLFYPWLMPYEPLFSKIFKHTEPEWEGLCYTGMAAMLGLIIILFVQLYRLVKGRFRLLLSVTDNKTLNILFWMSVFLAWFACGHPIVGQHENWLPYLGPLKQFRAVGRFAWAFYYLANIVVVYRIYKLFQGKRIAQVVLCTIIAGFLLNDGYFYRRYNNVQYNNPLPTINDPQCLLPENQWRKKVDPKKFQAILPLPFYSIGSENLAKQPPPGSDIIFQSYTASIQTGLPIFATCGARVSISQTYKMLSMAFDPVQPFGVLNDIHDTRPFLLLVGNDPKDSLTPNEKRILSYAKPIDKSEHFDLFSLSLEDLKSVYSRCYAEVQQSYEQKAKYPFGKFLLSDSGAPVIYKSFDDDNGYAYKGAHGSTWMIRGFNVIYDSLVPQGDVVFSFWMNNMNKDLYSRTVMEAYVTDTTGKCIFYDAVGTMWRVQALDGPWALIEDRFHADLPKGHLKITLWNLDHKVGVFEDVDELLIRPASTDVFSKDGATYFLNNRYYKPGK